VLFTDIVSSTELLSARVDSVLMKHSGSRVKHTGDGVFALFDGPTKAARCGLELALALARAAFPFAPVFTWANAIGAATSGAAWRCTSVPG